ncbi:uncharacterized protein [Drosophila pseudoobscura]|uniref:Uncharacterized protein n=1 Tax=Drosophila pseudoobscura pseudoobscura TaxID=46245 RepID=A0A6I8UZ64_DROPS|nr:uncharacterized protein LOC6902393 [Drosophila pseudoobscura]
MFGFNLKRKVVLCVIILMVVFIFVNHNGELKPDSPQSKLSRKPNLEPITLHNKSVIKNVQPATVLDPQKINIQTIEKTPISVAENFFVFSPKCKIPYVDPLSEDFLNMSVPYPYKTCTEDPDLFSVLYHRKTKHYILHLNKEVMKTRFSNISNYACFYFETMAGTNDSYAVARRAELIENDFIVPHHFLGLVVQCNDLDNNSRVLQADAFSFVQHPVDRNETSDAWRGTNYPSVFLFGIDTMSRMNFHRTMPLTSKFVRHSGWYEMEGYNKVADNTLPNLLAVLTGRSAKNWSKGCNLKTAGCFNYITYLWDHFHNAGYLTAYAEDLSSISTFNYLKSGFVRKPVDFYLRPFVTILEHVLKSVEWIGCKYCLGRRHSFSYVFDYAKQLIQRFVHETPKPLFGFFWTSSFTHDDHSGGANLDAIYVKYLEEFKEYGLFDRAIVILFSDHGARYGYLANHPTGFLEERLPMLHIYLPPWYRRRYPQVARALRLNRNRLTSSYDLHLGIRHILEQIRPGIDFISSYSCIKCRSLLRVVPKNRGCSDANIPIHWCACETYVPVATTGLALQLAQVIVYRMNQFLAKLNLDADCETLYLRKLLKASRQLHFDDVGVEIAPPNGMEIYKLEFTTSPNNGKFRSLVRSKFNAEHVSLDLDEISRLNSYRNESYCAEDILAKKLCVCLKKTYSDDEHTKIRRVRYGWLKEQDDEYDESNDVPSNVNLKLNV